MHREHKVVVSVFCGRRRRTRLLLAYLNRLCAAGLVDEVHLWDFCRDPKDRVWLSTIPTGLMTQSAVPTGLTTQSAVSTTSSGPYRVMRPDEVALSCADDERPPGFRIYYRYYWEQRHKLKEERTILIKCDDDIVAVDTDNFTKFLDMRIDNPDYLLVLPNIVNNGVAAYFQQRAAPRPAIPKSLMELEMPWHGICGSLWESGDLCERLHRWFVLHPDYFSYAGHNLIEPHVRVSINFFAVLPEHVALVFEGAAEAGDDERYLSVDACLEHARNKAICCEMYVSHLTFFMQEKKMTQKTVSDLVHLYEEFLMQSHHTPLASTTAVAAITK